MTKYPNQYNWKKIYELSGSYSTPSKIFKKDLSKEVFIDTFNIQELLYNGLVITFQF